MYSWHQFLTQQENILLSRILQAICNIWEEDCYETVSDTGDSVFGVLGVVLLTIVNADEVGQGYDTSRFKVEMSDLVGNSSQLELNMAAGKEFQQLVGKDFPSSKFSFSQ